MHLMDMDPTGEQENLDNEQILESLDLLEKAKSDHKRYLHQTRLHLRIQSVQTEINAQLRE